MLFERIKLLAEKRKLSLNQVEEALGLTKNYLYNLKRSKPNSELLVKLANFFNVSSDYLLGIDKEEPQMMFRLNFDGFSEDEKVEMTEELERYLEMLKLSIKSRRK